MGSLKASNIQRLRALIASAKTLVIRLFLRTFIHQILHSRGVRPGHSLAIGFAIIAPISRLVVDSFIFSIGLR